MTSSNLSGAGATPTAPPPPYQELGIHPAGHEGAPRGGHLYPTGGAGGCCQPPVASSPPYGYPYPYSSASGPPAPPAGNYYVGSMGPAQYTPMSNSAAYPGYGTGTGSGQGMPVMGQPQSVVYMHDANKQYPQAGQQQPTCDAADCCLGASLACLCCCCIDSVLD